MSKLTLTFKGRELRVIHLTQGSMLIGSDPGCKIHIDNLAVEPNHARLETHGDDTILFDLKSAEGTYVNQERISEHKLKDGDMIRVGKHMLTYKFTPTADLDSSDNIIQETPDTQFEGSPEKQIDEEHSRYGWLQILNGQNLGQTINLNRSMTNIGKPRVATAVITRRDDGFFLSHLEGKVPPSVQNQPIDERGVKLNDGDIIQIGNVKMQFYLE